MADATSRRRWPVRLLLALLGTAAAVGVAEMVFRSRDSGAFPHLNVYRSDPQLGVRLQPGTAQAVQFGGAGNRITHVEIGPEGFRGALPQPGSDDVLVVGDSQVFGLGVEQEQTFSAALQNELRKVAPAANVVNLGVPTYGPDEYLAVLEEALQRYKPKHVVFTVNMVNDLFEATRPNRDRHAVLDGWAIRKERMPTSLWPLPARATLLGRSHLVYAFRRSSQPGPEFASEGGYTDLAGTAAQLVAAETRAHAEFELGTRKHSAEEDTAYQAYAKLDARLHQTLFNEIICEGTARIEGYDGPDATSHDKFSCGIIDTTQKPGTTFETEPHAEESRTVQLTAEHLRRAALLRAYLDDNPSAIAEVERIPAVKAIADQRNAARVKVIALRGERPRYVPPSTPLSPALDKLAALGAAHAAKVVVVVLPIDVAVSKDEWAKYGQTTPIDMSPVNELSRAVVLQSRQRGLLALDSTPLLKDAEPGAFLDGDIHMTVKGHDAVAQGLAQVLLAPPPAETKDGATGQMSGLSYAQLKSDYGLKHKWCQAFRAPGEQLTLACPLTALESIAGAEVGGGGPLDGVSFVDRDSSTVLAGTLGPYALLHFDAASEANLLLRHADRVRPLAIRDARGEVQTRPSLLAPRTEDSQIALVNSENTPSFLCARKNPSEDVGPADADCERTYGSDCRLLLACDRGADYARPDCRGAKVNFGRFGRCMDRCDAAHPCQAPSTCAQDGAVSACVVKAQNKPAKP